MSKLLANFLLVLPLLLHPGFQGALKHPLGRPQFVLPSLFLTSNPAPGPLHLAPGLQVEV